MRGTKSRVTMLAASMAVTLFMTLGGCAAGYYDDGRPHWDGNVFHHEGHETDYGRWSAGERSAGETAWTGPRANGHESSGGGHK